MINYNIFLRDDGRKNKHENITCKKISSGVWNSKNFA